MRRLLPLSRDQAIGGCAFVVLATVACLSPVHNDTWWHLAYGREMAQMGGFGQGDHFAYTTQGRGFPNHQWLGERLMYGAWVVGGMPLLTACCAAMLAIGWLLCWRLTRGPALDRLLVCGAAAAASTMIWSIRPQVFTVALLPAVVSLLAQRREAWIPLVVAVWSNLHGGVLLGLLALGIWTAMSLVYDRPRFRALAIAAAASALATCATPLGLGYWPAVVASLQRSRLHRLQEWQPPALPPEHFFFWAMGAALIVLAVWRWSRLAASGDRAVVGTALVLLPSAARSLRNVAPFVMLAAPALTRLWFPADVGQRLRPTLAAGAIVGVTALAAMTAVGFAWTAQWSRLNWAPISPPEAAAIRECPSPIYNTYTDGGPIIWFVPSQRVFVDSRQDPFPDGLVQAATDLENGADPRPLFQRFGINCAVLPHHSPTVPALLADGWRQQYRSPRWVVVIRPGK